MKKTTLGDKRKSDYEKTKKELNVVWKQALSTNDIYSSKDRQSIRILARRASFISEEIHKELCISLDL